MSQIHELIPKIMAEVGAIGKDKRNQQQGFQYRGIDDAYNALQPLLAKYGVFTVPAVLDRTREERQTTKGGTLLYSILTIRYTFYAPDGSSVEAVVVGEGMDSGDKASNKGMAVAHKYALLQVFAVPTEVTDDPDAQVHAVAPQTVTDDQLCVLRDMMASTQTQEAAFCQYLKVPALESLPASRYTHAMTALNAKAAKMAQA